MTGSSSHRSRARREPVPRIRRPLAIMPTPADAVQLLPPAVAQVRTPPDRPIREELVHVHHGIHRVRPSEHLDPTRTRKVVKARHPFIPTGTGPAQNPGTGIHGGDHPADIQGILEPGVWGPHWTCCAPRPSRRWMREPHTSYCQTGTFPRGGPHAQSPGPVAVHQHLINRRKRIQTALVVESVEPRRPALRIAHGYVPTAVNPYMALAVSRTSCPRAESTSHADNAERNYLRPDKGLLKIMSKMGMRHSGPIAVPALRGRRYRPRRHRSTSVTHPPRLCGIDWTTSPEYLRIHEAAISPMTTPRTDQGIYTYRKDGERHC